MRQMPPAAALLVMLAALAALPTVAQYKVVGPDGRVTYTDRPPTDPGHRVQAMRKSGALAGDAAAADGAATSGLPLALREAATRFPVTLITASDCAPCDTARQQLQRRGVPYVERSVASNEDSQALQRLSGSQTVPTVRIGGQMLQGWLDSEWQATLDLAGYPRQSALPKGWRWAAPTPLATREASSSPAPATAPAPAAAAAEPTAAVPADAASGPQIRF